VRAAGASIELRFQFTRFELSSSLEFQRAVLSDGSVLPNSPGQVGKFRATAPLWRNRIRVSVGMQALGQRNTYDGAAVPWVILPETVVTTKPLAGGLQISMGIKNLSNSFYRDPVGLSEAVDSMIGAGRSYYLNLGWHIPDRRGESDNAKNFRKASPDGF
jgi:hypothetical protein